MLTGEEEVREAMRLDSPCPLGARILLADMWPFSLTSPLSLSSISSPVFSCWWAESQEAGRPTVEN